MYEYEQNIEKTYSNYSACSKLTFVCVFQNDCERERKKNRRGGKAITN